MRKRQKGFTILEALVSSVLFFMAISVAVMAFMAGSNHFTGSQDTIEACHSGYDLLQMITTELREADPDTLTISSSKESITFTKYHYPSSSLVAITWSLDAASNRIRRSYAGHSPRFFGTHILKLIFEETTKTVPASLSRINVSLAIGSKSSSEGGGRKLVELSEDAYLRANQPAEATVLFIEP